LVKFHLACLTLAQNLSILTVISALCEFYKVTLIGTCQWAYPLYTVQVHSQLHYSVVSRIRAYCYLQHTGRNYLVTQTNLQRTVTEYFRTASYSMKIMVKYSVKDAMSGTENATPITERNEHLSGKLTQHANTHYFQCRF